MSKASEYLHDLAFSPMSERWRNLGPGQVVLNLPKEKRDLLATLKSDDLANIRHDFIWGTPEDNARWQREKNKHKEVKHEDCMSERYTRAFSRSA